MNFMKKILLGFAFSFFLFPSESFALTQSGFVPPVFRTKASQMQKQKASVMPRVFDLPRRINKELEQRSEQKTVAPEVMMPEAGGVTSEPVDSFMNGETFQAPMMDQPPMMQGPFPIQKEMSEEEKAVQTELEGIWKSMNELKQKMEALRQQEQALHQKMRMVRESRREALEQKREEERQAFEQKRQEMQEQWKQQEQKLHEEWKAKEQQWQGNWKEERQEMKEEWNGEKEEWSDENGGMGMPGEEWESDVLTPSIETVPAMEEDSNMEMAPEARPMQSENRRFFQSPVQEMIPRNGESSSGGEAEGVRSFFRQFQKPFLPSPSMLEPSLFSTSLEKVRAKNNEARTRMLKLRNLGK